MEGIRRALLLGLVLIARTAIEPASSVGPFQCIVQCIIKCIIICIFKCIVKCIVKCIIKCISKCIAKCIIICTLKCIGKCIIKCIVICIIICIFNYICLPTPLNLVYVGKSDNPAFGPPARLSLHLVSSSITPAEYVHKSRGDNVVYMWVQLKR